MKVEKKLKKGIDRQFYFAKVMNKKILSKYYS